MGAFSDRHGRKRALQLSVIAMSGATAAIGLLPTYAMAGSLATCLLVLCRLVQGLSVANSSRARGVPVEFGAARCHEHRTSGRWPSRRATPARCSAASPWPSCRRARARTPSPATAGAIPSCCPRFWGGAATTSRAPRSRRAPRRPPRGRRRRTRATTWAAAEPARAPADRRGARSGRGRRGRRRRQALGAEGRRARGGLHPVARGFYAFFVFAPAFYPLPQATLLATRCLLLSVLAMPLAGAAIAARRATPATASQPTPRRRRRLPWALHRRRSSRASPRRTRTPPRWAWRWPPSCTARSTRRWPAGSCGRSTRDGAGRGARPRVERRGGAGRGHGAGVRRAPDRGDGLGRRAGLLHLRPRDAGRRRHPGAAASAAGRRRAGDAVYGRRALVGCRVSN